MIEILNFLVGQIGLSQDVAERSASQKDSLIPVCGMFRYNCIGLTHEELLKFLQASIYYSILG